MISQSAEYAIRAAVCLSQHPDQALTSQQLARAASVSPAYLKKILQLLGRANLVQARRGLGGGYVLCVPPDKLTIRAVISAVDSTWRPGATAAEGSRLCAYYQPLNELMGRIEQLFATTTVTDLLPQCASHGLCVVPGDAAGRRWAASAASPPAKAV